MAPAERLDELSRGEVKLAEFFFEERRGSTWQADRGRYHKRLPNDDREGSTRVDDEDRLSRSVPAIIPSGLEAPRSLGPHDDRWEIPCPAVTVNLEENGAPVVHEAG